MARAGEDGASPRRDRGLLAALVAPPLLNSASPWATTLEDLRLLYSSPATGAVTTRTCLPGPQGFAHDPSAHTYAFFSADGEPVAAAAGSPPSREIAHISSLNTLGYSPLPLAAYLDFARELVAGDDIAGVVGSAKRKSIVVSVTGTPADVAECHARISAAARVLRHPLLMEVNLSCPNIPGRPPPAYDAAGLVEYLRVLAPSIEGKSRTAVATMEGLYVPVGIKVPPYTHGGQVAALVAALDGCRAANGAAPVDFVTATNTLGNCLFMAAGGGANGADDENSEGWSPALGSSLPSAGVGGMGGAGLHALALGNMVSIRRALNAHGLCEVEIIGVGGVCSRAGFGRMRAAGAACVGVATALGARGVGVFEDILGRGAGLEPP